MNIYEQAVINKVRFDVNDGANGTIATEDLRDLSLSALDKMYGAIFKQIKTFQEESFLKTKQSINVLAELKLELVKHTMTVKLEEKEAAKLAKENKEEAEQLMEILADKQKAAKQNLTEAQIKARLKKLTK